VRQKIEEIALINVTLEQHVAKGHPFQFVFMEGQRIFGQVRQFKAGDQVAGIQVTIVEVLV
jgi:hypothetical protein